jgi:hypothetical protein
MTIVCIIGDIHGNFDVIHTLQNNLEDVDIFLQVGDLAGWDGDGNYIYTSFDKPLIFIAGNHENFDILSKYDTDTINLKERIKIKKNLYYLPIGHCIRYKGIMIAGLGGNHSSVRYKMNRNDLQGQRRRHYTRRDVNRLLSIKDPIDILLTHEASSPHHSFKHHIDLGRPEINRLIYNLKPTYHFYGHHHLDYKNQVIDKTISTCVQFEEFEYIEIERSK